MIDEFYKVVRYFRVTRRVRRLKRGLKRTRRKIGGAGKNSASRKEYAEHRARARALVLNRIEHFNAMYGFKFGTIRIKNQKSRWGSCSKKGNLNFNYRIALLPEKLADYIIVHELCHLGEFNHSQNFWNLVAKAMPDYAARRRELKKIHVR